MSYKIASTQSQYQGLAQRINGQMFEAHRGAFAIGGGLAVVFGNDGYAPESCAEYIDGEFRPSTKSRRAVEKLRDLLKCEGVEEKAFDLSDDGYTWAMVVSTDAVDWLMGNVWEAWGCARGHFFRVIQGSIADRVIAENINQVWPLPSRK